MWRLFCLYKDLNYKNNVFLKKMFCISFHCMIVKLHMYSSQLKKGKRYKNKGLSLALK